MAGNGEANRPWQVLGKNVLYASPWMNLEQWDVRLPDGSRIPDHHVLTFPREAVGVIPVGADGSLLLIDHYRFQTDTRGWEIPAGNIEAGETLEAAARRELLEETGCVAASVEVLGKYHPSNGSGNQTFHVAVARGARQITAQVDANETLGLRWFTPDEARALAVAGKILDGFSLTGLLWMLSAEQLVSALEQT